MRIPIWLAFFIFVFPLAAFLLLFGGLVIHGVAKLHLSQEAAAVLVFGMLACGFVNIPIKRILRDEGLAHHPLAIFGLSDFWPRLQGVRQDVIITLNVGGCLIPASVAMCEHAYLSTLGWSALFGGGIAVITNVILAT